ncbi:MAG: long-chain-acyl-CoA synthetase [Hahellaceae bacterium]|nr:long-chain-acyl-CoA synthetase [Hahellaceae bacterium]MCP5211116.1 long-chain-acyl-CoA synthetase [Hahellaceae bacterium]
MSADVISARDVLRQIPPLLGRVGSIVKGYKYYSLKDVNAPYSLGKVIEENARRFPKNTAIFYQDTVINYEDFNAWANRFAQYFRARGIVKGDNIALFLENRPELLAALAGATKIGAACAMLNTSQKGQVLEHSINLIQPKLFVIGEELIENFETVKTKVTNDPSTCLFLADTNTLENRGQAPEGYINLAESSLGFPGENPSMATPVKLGDTCVYLFTSGTTGLPKATPCNHKKFFKAYGGFGMMSLDMKPSDVLYVTLPLYHGTALLVCWGSALSGGAAIAIRRRFSASEFWQDVKKYNATCFGYVGELCRYLLNQPARPDDSRNSLVKMVGNGLRPSIWKEFKQRFGIDQVVELYGSSEGNVGFSNFLNLDNTVGFSTAPFALVKYHEGTRDPIRSDKGRMEKVTKGEAGLLLGKINKKWSFEGYTQEEATEKAILRDVFKKGDAWFNTGDLLRNIGCRHLQFVDRMGDTFRWKGENVSTTEVENIFDASSLVEETIVYGVEVPNTNGKAGMATIVASKKNGNFDIDKLYEYLQANLPAYAIPVFIRLTDSVDKTGTFKYKKGDLKSSGFKLNERTGDTVFVLLPGQKSYVQLTADIATGIENNEYRF